MDEKIIGMSKEDLRNILVDWTECIYENTPPKSVYDDLLFTLPDFLDAYFDTAWKNEESSQ